MGVGVGPGAGRLDRVLAGAVGLSATRVHQLLADVDLDVLEGTLGQLREVGWPAPEDPDAGEDVELGGRELVADRLDDEVDWLRQVASWLVQLDAGGYPPAVNLRPSEDWPDTRSLPSTSPEPPRCSTGSRPTSPSWPAPGGSRIWRWRRYSQNADASGAAAWPSRTWTSPRSAGPNGCPPPADPNSNPGGMPGRLIDLAAAKSISTPPTPTTHTGLSRRRRISWGSSRRADRRVRGLSSQWKRCLWATSRTDRLDSHVVVRAQIPKQEPKVPQKEMPCECPSVDGTVGLQDATEHGGADCDEQSAPDAWVIGPTSPDCSR